MAWDQRERAGIGLGFGERDLSGILGEEQESAWDQWEGARSARDLRKGAGSGHGSAGMGLESAVDFGIGAGRGHGSVGKDLEMPLDFGKRAGINLGFWEEDWICQESMEEGLELAWDQPGILGKELEEALDFGRGAGICLGSAGKGLEVGNAGSWEVLGMFRIPKFQIQNRDVADGIPRPDMNPGRE